MAHDRDSGLKMSKEDKLLLLCIRTRMNDEVKDQIKFLVQQGIDWDLLLRRSFRHRLAPLLYWQLNSVCVDSVPSEILERLKTFFNENIHKNLLFLGELLRILKSFEAQGIDVIPYKGLVLASIAYDNIGLRQFNDLDFLINKMDVQDVKNLLSSQGYELIKSNISGSFYLKTQRECLFVNKNSGILLEIHWNIQGPHISIKNNSELLYTSEEFIKVNINNQTVPSFSLENLILILSLHNAKHDWNYLSWICDISELIKNNQISWPQVIEKADKLGVKRILFINLLLAKDILELEIPDNVLYFIESDLPAKKLSIQLKKRFFEKKSFNIFEKFYFDLQKRENKLDGIMDCVKSLTTPSHADFEDISLPKFLFPLYYFIRPILLLKRYGKDTL